MCPGMSAKYWHVPLSFISFYAQAEALWFVYQDNNVIAGIQLSSPFIQVLFKDP